MYLFDLTDIYAMYGPARDAVPRILPNTNVEMYIVAEV
jgi:hypothetical protein